MKFKILKSFNQVFPVFHLTYVVVKHNHVHRTIQPTYFLLVEEHQPSTEALESRPEADPFHLTLQQDQKSTSQ